MHHRLERRQIARICELIQANNPIIRILIQHMEDKVASDKSGAAGYDDRHKNLSLGLPPQTLLGDIVPKPLLRFAAALSS